MTLFETAITFAETRHKGQFRRDGTTPYIVHVTQVVSRTPDDEVLKAVAALHDVIEDRRATYNDLRDLLCDVPDAIANDVMHGVHTLTRQRDETYEEFIVRVKATRGGMFVPVKVADLLSNLADEPTPGQIRRYARALLVLVEDES